MRNTFCLTNYSVRAIFLSWHGTLNTLTQRQTLPGFLCVRPKTNGNTADRGQKNR